MEVQVEVELAGGLGVRVQAECVGARVQVEGVGAGVQVEGVAVAVPRLPASPPQY